MAVAWIFGCAVVGVFGPSRYALMVWFAIRCFQHCSYHQQADDDEEVGNACP